MFQRQSCIYARFFYDLLQGFLPAVYYIIVCLLCHFCVIISVFCHICALIFLIQSRAASLSKQLSDIHEQVEQCFVELNTFEGLRSQELQAIPRRTQVCLCVRLLMCICYFVHNVHISITIIEEKTQVNIWPGTSSVGTILL